MTRCFVKCMRFVVVGPLLCGACGGWAQGVPDRIQPTPEIRSLLLEEYRLFFEAQSQIQKKEHYPAIEKLRRVLQVTTTTRLQVEARLLLAQSYVAIQQDRLALRELEYLEKRERGDARYAEVLWQLIGVENRLNRSRRVCTRARRLYAEFPADPVVQDWGVTMWRNKYQGAAINCEVSFSDIRSRMKRLQLNGQAVRARQEIEELRKSTPGRSFEIETLLADHLLWEGFAADGLDLLLNQGGERFQEEGFLQQVGGAAARAGEEGLALGVFDRLAQKAGRSAKGAQWRYHAGFLCYRFQDYDGAARRWEELLKQGPVSSKRRLELRWNLAWLKYLRGHWSLAAADFKSLLDEGRLSRDSERDISWQRVAYWYGRALHHMGYRSSAQGVWESVQQDPLRGYYALAARAWLQKEKSGGAVAPEFDRDVASRMPRRGPQSTEPSEPEPDAGAEESSEIPVFQLSDAADPRLSQKLEKARELIALGLPAMAEWELLDVERKTRNREHLKALMNAYSAVKGYNRASYIGGLVFASQRQRGMENARNFWEAAYPRAFDGDVKLATRETSVSPFFVWSIMRAESQYRPRIFSPVGAVGLMQLMPSTAHKMAERRSLERYRVPDLLEPAHNIRLGTFYLDRLLSKFRGDLALSAAAYNAGPHRVEEWLYSFGSLQADEFIEHIPFAETRGYVKRVLRNYAIYSELYTGAPAPSSLWTDPPAVQVTARPSGRESWD